MAKAHSSFLYPFVEEMKKLTDAPPIFLRGCSTTLLGAFLSQERYKCIVAEGETGTWTNLYTVLLGDSGSDRKSTTIKMMAQILKRLDPDLRGPDDMSPEGLAKALKVRQNEANNPSLFLLQSEFINLLLQFRRQYSQVLRGMFLNFYDIIDYRRQLKNEMFEINDPRVSLIGGIPCEILAQYGTPEDWQGGFFNRCLFLSGTKEREQAERPCVPPETYDRLAMGLRGALDLWERAQQKRKGAQLKVSKAAKEIGATFGNIKEGDVHLDTMLSRAGVHFIKIAAIEQVDENPEASEIGKAAAERAADFVDAWRATLPDLITTSFARGREDYEGDRLSKRILRFMFKNAGAATLSEILTTCGLRKKQVLDALDALLAADILRIDLDDDQTVHYKVKKAR